MNEKRTVRIGGACAGYGDGTMATPQLIRDGSFDVGNDGSRVDGSGGLASKHNHIAIREVEQGLDKEEESAERDRSSKPLWHGAGRLHGRYYSERTCSRTDCRASSSAESASCRHSAPDAIASGATSVMV